MAKYWYILQTFTSYERKIEQQLKTMRDKGELDVQVVTDITVPLEETTAMVKGKKRTKKEMILPGYVMLEMDLPEFGWKDTCSKIRALHGVSGFVGTNPNDRPRPISNKEVKNIFTKAGILKSEKPIKVQQNFAIGDTVKIIDGPFASFTGVVSSVNEDRDKLKVDVQIFGRVTPVETTLSQVEKN